MPVKKKRAVREKAANLFEAGITPPPELNSDREVAQAAATVLGEVADEEVTIGGRTIKVIELKWGAERQWNPIIGDYLEFLLGAWLSGPEQFAKALSVAVGESPNDLTRLAVIALGFYFKDDPAFIPYDGATREQQIEAWLNENATFKELIELIRAQMERNAVSDSLGKLWGKGVLSAKLAEVLSTTPLPPGQTSTPSSNGSASATSSSPPTS